MDILLRLFGQRHGRLAVVMQLIHLEGTNHQFLKPKNYTFAIMGPQVTFEARKCIEKVLLLPSALTKQALLMTTTVFVRQMDLQDQRTSIAQQLLHLIRLYSPVTSAMTLFAVFKFVIKITLSLLTDCFMITLVSYWPRNNRLQYSFLVLIKQRKVSASSPSRGKGPTMLCTTAITN